MGHEEKGEEVTRMADIFEKLNPFCVHFNCSEYPSLLTMAVHPTKVEKCLFCSRFTHRDMFREVIVGGKEEESQTQSQT